MNCCGWKDAFTVENDKHNPADVIATDGGVYMSKITRLDSWIPTSSQNLIPPAQNNVIPKQTSPAQRNVTKEPERNSIAFGNDYEVITTQPAPLSIPPPPGQKTEPTGNRVEKVISTSPISGTEMAASPGGSTGHGGPALPTQRGTLQDGGNQAADVEQQRGAGQSSAMYPSGGENMAANGPGQNDNTYVNIQDILESKRSMEEARIGEHPKSIAPRGNLAIFDVDEVDIEEESSTTDYKADSRNGNNEYAMQPRSAPIGERNGIDGYNEDEIQARSESKGDRNGIDGYNEVEIQTMSEPKGDRNGIDGYTEDELQARSEPKGDRHDIDGYNENEIQARSEPKGDRNGIDGYNEEEIQARSEPKGDRNGIDGYNEEENQARSAPMCDQDDGYQHRSTNGCFQEAELEKEPDTKAPEDQAKMPDSDHGKEEEDIYMQDLELGNMISDERNSQHGETASRPDSVRSYVSSQEQTMDKEPDDSENEKHDDDLRHKGDSMAHIDRDHPSLENSADQHWTYMADSDSSSSNGSFIGEFFLPFDVPTAI